MKLNKFDELKEELKDQQNKFQKDILEIIKQKEKQPEKVSQVIPIRTSDRICQIEVISNKKVISQQEMIIVSQNLVKEIKPIMEKYKVSQVRAVMTFLVE